MMTFLQSNHFIKSPILVLAWGISSFLVDAKAITGNDDLLETAEITLLYQRSNGGWPKNYDHTKPLSPSAKAKLLAQKNNNDSTIDNGATYKEIRILAQAYQLEKDAKFRSAANRGIEYLLTAQYKNGGWPQTFPNPSGYHRHITFNDNAMIGVLILLDDIGRNNQLFSFATADIRRRCQSAVANGIQCILQCQIRVDGKRLVWCGQHHYQTLAPTTARSYELPSLSGSESVDVVRFLMQVENQDRQITESIESAINWFQSAKLEGIKLVRIQAPQSASGFDKVLIDDPNAPPLWARFYDLRSNQPFFCGRDGIAKESIAEISHERRNGYSWLGEYAKTLLSRDYPAWKKRSGKKANQ